MERLLIILMCVVTVVRSGCPSPGDLPISLAARLYQNDYCSGAYLDIAKGTSSGSHNYWGRVASSLVVRPNCLLKTWDSKDFTGDAKFFHGGTYGKTVAKLSVYPHAVSHDWNDRISSWMAGS